MSRFSENRQNQVFEIALSLLEKKGYQKLTMLDVAKECKMSKETIYRWYGSKAGLFKTMISADVDIFKENLSKLFHQKNVIVYDIFYNFALQYIGIITSKNSISINAAAISEVKIDPELADILLSSGRYVALPMLTDFIKKQQQQKILKNDRTAENLAETLLGLTAKDLQIRLLLEDKQLDNLIIDKQICAKEAADDFMVLFAYNTKI